MVGHSVIRMNKYKSVVADLPFSIVGVYRQRGGTGLSLSRTHSDKDKNEHLRTKIKVMIDDKIYSIHVISLSSIRSEYRRFRECKDANPSL